MRNLAVITLAVLALFATLAQADDTVWVRTWRDGQECRGKAVAANGTDIFVAGTRLQESEDIFAVKYDAAGDTAWASVLDLDTIERTLDIAVGTDGQPVVCAQVEGDPLKASLVKFNTSGDTAWTRHLDRVQPSNLAVGTGNAVYLWASVFDTIPMEAFTLARYEADGTLAWQKYVQLGQANLSAGCCADAAGNIIATGTAFDSLGPVPAVLKFDASGDTLWTRTLSGLDINLMLGIAAGAGDTIVATGMSGPDTKVTRLAGTGDTVWTRSYSLGHTTDDLNSVAMDGQGATVLPRNRPGSAAELVKLGHDGDVLWQGDGRVPGAQSAVCVDSENRPVTAGETTEGIPSCLTIKWEGQSGVEDPGRPARVEPQPGATVLDSNGLLSFQADLDGDYSLRLFDATGALVREVHSGRLETGTHRFPVRELAAGSYTLSVQGPGRTEQSKVLVVR